MIITITSQNCSAQIDTLGAQLVSMKKDGTEYLWQGDKTYWGGQAPVLFPHVGGLRNNKAILKGKEIVSTRHGFARSSEFSVKEQLENSVTFSLNATDKSRSIYPYEFEFCVKFTLDGGVLNTEYITKNLSGEEMPFAVGGHPAFNVPLFEGEAFEDYEIVFSEAENADCPSVNLQTGLISFQKRNPMLENASVIPLKHSLFDSDALVFDNLKSRCVKVCSSKTGKGVEVDFSQFTYLGIWSQVGEAPFVAIEPWTGCATCEDEDDEFTHKRSLTFLKPDDVSAVSFTTRMI